MRSRLILVVLLVAVWALWGSVVVAFDHCMAMGAPCEAPCSLGTAATLALPTSAPSAPPAVLMSQTGLPLPTPVVRGLDPVPRSFRLRE